MPTTGERRALWFVAIVALSGSAVRLWRADAPAASPALDRQLARVDSVRGRAASREPRGRRASPASPAGAAPAVAVPLDLDRASAEEMERLPGVGPALARRIIANRDSAGAFGAMEALCGVRGVGPSLAERLRPLVTFSGPRRPVSSACGAGSKASRKARVGRH